MIKITTKANPHSIKRKWKVYQTLYLYFQYVVKIKWVRPLSFLCYPTIISTTFWTFLFFLAYLQSSTRLLCILSLLLLIQPTHTYFTSPFRRFSLSLLQPNSHSGTTSSEGLRGRICLVSTHPHDLLKTLPLPHLIQYLDSGGVFHPFLSTIHLLHYSPVVDQSHRVSSLLSSWGSDVLWWLIQYCGLLISQASHLQQTSLLHSSHLTKRQILPLQNHDFSSLIIGFSSFCCLFHTCTSSGLVVYWSFYIWPIHQSPFVVSFHFQLIFTWFGVSKHSNECCIISWSSLFLFKSYGKIAVLFFLKNSVHLHLEAKSCFRKPHHRDKMFSLDLILIFKWLSTLTNNTTATYFLNYHMLISSLF